MRQNGFVVRGLVGLAACAVIAYAAAATPRYVGASSRLLQSVRPTPGSAPRFAQGFAGGGGVQPDVPLVKQFDKDGDKRLNRAERRAARDYINANGGYLPGRRGFGFSGGGRRSIEPGRRLAPADVQPYATAPLYDAGTLRTLFLTFDSNDWEDELIDFYHTDVEVPATVVVDGKTYSDVGVHFRGNSSFRMVPKGQKHSLALAFDFVHDDQQIGGYRTLHLLNGHADPSFIKAVLYTEIARDYIPAPKANFMRVVINGESWGVYPHVQPFNKDFVRDWFRTSDGERWTAPGTPRGRAGLEYLGENAEPYKELFEIKSKDEPAAWSALINLAKVLNRTPIAGLEAALDPILDVDGALKFLALDNALINNDGYWIRASDYSLYRDRDGRFHIVPHDFNESVNEVEGRGFGGGAPASSVELDPLIGLDDPAKPFRSRLLAVPALRARYLRYVRDIADRWLDWQRLGPIAARYQALIAADVEADTRKLYSFDQFDAASADRESIRSFAERRRAYLLAYAPSEDHR